MAAMTTTMFNIPRTLPKTYRALVDILPPRPIHTEAEYNEVAAVVDRLAVLDRRTNDQNDYLDALARFIMDYDDVHYPDPYVPPIQMLKFLMDQHDMSANDLGRLLGDRSLGSKILHGERQL